MLADLVRFARDPVRSRRNAAVRVFIALVIAGLGPALMHLWMAPHHGFSFDPLESGILLVAFLSILVVFNAPLIAIFTRSRRQRERHLSRSTGTGEVVQSVYLTPNLIRFIERQTNTAMNPYAESVTLVITRSAIEFWSGSARPTLVAVIDFAAIDSAPLLRDEERFPRPEIKTANATIPLYATSGLFGISRGSSRKLYDSLLAALRSAGVPAEVD